MSKSDSDDEIWEYASRKKEKKKVTKKSSNKREIAISPIIALRETKRQTKRHDVKKLPTAKSMKSKANFRSTKPARETYEAKTSDKDASGDTIITSQRQSQTLKLETCQGGDDENASLQLQTQSQIATKTPKSKPISQISQCQSSATRRKGNCPFCQVPFSALSYIESPRWHVTDCMDNLDEQFKEECKAGVECDSTIPSHYKRYCHSILAQLRSNAPSSQCDLGSLHETQKVTRKLNFDTVNNDNKIENSRRQSDNTYQLHTELCNSEVYENPKRVVDNQNKQYLNQLPEIETVVPDDCGTCSDEDIFLSKDSDETTDNEVTQLKLKTEHFVDNVSGTPKYPIYQKCEPVNVHVSSCNDSVFDSKDVSDLLENAFDDSMDSDISKPLIVDKKASLMPAIELSDVLDDDRPFGAISQKTHMSSSDQYLHRLVPEKNNTTNKLCKVSPSKKLISKTPLKSQGQRNTRTRTPKSKVGRATPAKTSTLSHPGSTGDCKTKQLSIASFFNVHGNTKKKIDAISTTLSGKTTVAAKATKATVPFATGSAACSGSGLLQVPQTNSTSSTVSNTLSDTSDSRSCTESNDSDRGYKRKCPFYKKIPGTTFVVDAFSYGVVPGIKAYFLSHFHYDHYIGLKKSFSEPIYCTKCGIVFRRQNLKSIDVRFTSSEEGPRTDQVNHEHLLAIHSVYFETEVITGNLVLKKIRVQPSLIHYLPLDTPVMVHDVEVTLIEANHCPGAVLFVFRLKNGKVYLHTGDFRADPKMEMHPALVGTEIDQLYLDTTYCDPAYAFPPQQDVINYTVRLAVNFMEKNPCTLIVVGSYTIGKERIFRAVADALNCKICVTRDKKNIIDCLEDSRLNERITLKAKEARVHVLPMRQIRYNDLVDHLKALQPQYDQILALEPTGWAHSKKTPSLENLKPKCSRSPITIYGIPYSEHSSYEEMKRFVQVMRPKKILPTVNNGSAASRHKMEQLFESWNREVESSPQKRMRQSVMQSWTKS